MNQVTPSGSSYQERDAKMNSTLYLLQHPFRDNRTWGDMFCAMMGLLQFILAMTILGDLATKPAYALAVYFSPVGWTVSGLVLCILHVSSLTYQDARQRLRARLWALSFSLAFWTHFTVSIAVNSLLFNGPFPGALMPALGTPLLAGVLLYRLWKEY
jgi:hypothetical protein